MKAAWPIAQVPVRQEMDDRQFAQWVRLIEQRTGTVVASQRKSFLLTSLNIRMQEIGCESYQQYYELLSTGINGHREWSVFVDRITVHETRFFRHEASLELVRELVRQKPRPEGAARLGIHAWSAGCASGEEAYTLAMTIDDALRQRGEDAYFGVTATDISQAALLTGRRGSYRQKRLDGVRAAYRDRYFSVLEPGIYQVCDELRKRVCFAQLNILDIGQASLGKMDLIYCQNLLIYFDRNTRKKLVNGMVEHLLPGGLLVLGSGELLGWNHPQMEKITCDHTLAYRKL